MRVARKMSGAHHMSLRGDDQLCNIRMIRMRLSGWCRFDYVEVDCVLSGRPVRIAIHFGAKNSRYTASNPDSSGPRMATADSDSHGPNYSALPFRVNFICANAARWPELLSGESTPLLDPDEIPERIISSSDCWIVCTYLRKCKAGGPRRTRRDMRC